MELIESANLVQPQPSMLLGQEAALNYLGSTECSGIKGALEIGSDGLNPPLISLAASQFPPEELILPTQQRIAPEVQISKTSEVDLLTGKTDASFLSGEVAHDLLVKNRLSQQANSDSMVFTASTAEAVFDSTINFSNFSNITGLTLNGNATQAGNVLQLTPALANQKGSAFLTTPSTINDNTSFQTYFQFRLQGGKRSKGADGFTFMLQNSNEGAAGAGALGSPGSSLGYSGITQSLAVEFDTYKNPGDINNNHIAVLRDGIVTNSLARVKSPLDINNGSLHNAWIDYDGDTEQLKVFLSGNTTKPATPLLTHTIDLASVVGSSAFVGFSAGTGGKFNAHNIESWEFTTTSTADTAPPTASLSATNITEKSTDYTFSVNYSDATAVNAETLDNGDVLVTGPNGFSQLATLVNVDSSSNGSPRTATYRINAPGGIWNADDNGIYTIELQPNQVSDTRDNFIPDVTLGSFQVDVAFNPGTIALSNTPIIISESDGTAEVTVVRTGGSDGTASIDYTTVDNTAMAGEDYTSTAGTLTFGDGETSKTITVSILSDGLPEETETFNVAIDNAVGATLGTKRTVLVSVADSDADQLTLSFNQPAINVGEGDGTVDLTISLSGKASTETITVNYATSNGTATAGSDYITTSGTLSFAPGEDIKTITVPILDNLSSLPEPNKLFYVTLSNPIGASLNTQSQADVTIVDDDTFIREAVISGLNQPTAFDWTPDGSRMYIAQKDGVVRMFDNGTLLPSPFINISNQVNNTRDRGLLGLAVHPEFPTKPYVYLLFTYDPPEVYQPDNVANPNTLAGPDEMGNRPSRLIRITADPSTNYTTALPGSEVVLLGKNSTWENTSRSDLDSTGNISIPPSGITASGTNIQDYLATDSQSHSIGMVKFGADGSLFVSNGDGASYGRVDPRAIRVQALDNLSGKILRIDPITGEGLSDNPFYDGDPNSNRSKVYSYGLRNPFRFTINESTHELFIGDVGWNAWEEINTGRGANYGWPYYEGGLNNSGNPVNLKQNGYASLPEAQAFYASGESATPPIFARKHASDVSAIVMGDFYTGTTFPELYQGVLFFGDINKGTVDAAIFDQFGKVSSIQRFATGLPYIVQMSTGPDANLYYANLAKGEIGRWRYTG